MTAAAKIRTSIAFCILVAMPVLAVANVWYPRVPMQERSVVAVLALVAFFLTSEPKNRLGFIFDTLCAILSVVAFGYVVVYWQELLMRQGAPTTADLVLGCIGIGLIIIATARCFGKGLTVIVLGFIAYSLWGQHLPVWLGGHRGFSIERIFTFIYTNENGVLGFAIDAALKYMALFLLLGKVLQYSGALNFIMNFARSLFGKGTSGPPLMAVMSSAMVGTVTGSSMANVYVSGNITIPLMKRAGVRPELAAAIEAAASNGAQILPPVMGFAVFFMIVMLDVSYIDIITAALIPGILYFLILGIAVWTRTRRIEGSEVPQGLEPTGSSLRQVLLSNGALTFALTLGALVFFLIRRDSLQMAAIYAIGICIVISMLGEDRFTPRKVVTTLRESGREFTEVAVVCLALGLITGPILLTGLGTKLPALMMDWASGSASLLLISAFAACVVLGLGVPTSMAYVIVALLVTNAITQLGIPKLDAHMFVFYAALAAMITPPVALSAYAAATIAGADYWKTGWLAATLGICKYLVPFAFVFRPELLLRGSALDIVVISLITTFGLVAVTLGLAVAEKRTLRGLSTLILMVGGGFLTAVPPFDAKLVTIGVLCSLAGLVLFVRAEAAHRPRLPARDPAAPNVALRPSDPQSS